MKPWVICPKCSAIQEDSRASYVSICWDQVSRFITPWTAEQLQLVFWLSVHLFIFVLSSKHTAISIHLIKEPGTQSEMWSHGLTSSWSLVVLGVNPGIHNLLTALMDPGQGHHHRPQWLPHDSLDSSHFLFQSKCTVFSGPGIIMVLSPVETLE